MQVRIKTPYFDETVTLHKESYHNGATALTSTSLDGEPFATLSVNITTDCSMPSNTLPKDHCYFKNWSENEGILECLEEAGLLKRTGVSAKTGYVSAPLVKILF